MKMITSEEFAAPPLDWLRRVNVVDDVLIVVGPDGQETAVIPGAWWLPAADGPPLDEPPQPADTRGDGGDGGGQDDGRP